MRFLPINLDVRGRRAVVVGGGRVGARKCLQLIEAGALPVVIDPELAPVLQELVAAGAVRHLARNYEPGDLADAYLAYATTDKPSVNREVAGEAQRAGILVEVCSEPTRGDFTTPAVLARGDFTVAVATAGLAPALAGLVRRELAAKYDDAYGDAVRILGAVREKLLTGNQPSAYNKRILRGLAGADLPGLLRARDYAGIDSLLTLHCGPGWTLTSLGLTEKDSP